MYLAVYQPLYESRTWVAWLDFLQQGFNFRGSLTIPFGLVT